MTDHQDRLDIVAAFADGESVAAADLNAALTHDDARAYLIDVLALRGLVSGARPQLSISPATASTTARRRPSALRLAAAAALVLISVATGFAVGQRTASSSSSGAATEQATERTQPISTDPTAPTDPSSAPAPTHVFRMENGVTWNERAGGN